MGAREGWIAARVTHLLNLYLDSGGRQGWVFDSEPGYRCFPDEENKVRKPDGSYIAIDRMARIPEGHLELSPDLAIEVVSPGDSAVYLDSKVEDYLESGVRIVWVVQPQTRTVTVFTPGTETRRLRPGDEIDGGEVLPGFAADVAEFFPPTG